MPTQQHIDALASSTAALLSAPDCPPWLRDHLITLLDAIYNAAHETDGRAAIAVTAAQIGAYLAIATKAEA